MIYSYHNGERAMVILVTGGAGYIGTHTLIELDKAGHTSIVIDNFVNSSLEAIHRVEKIINKAIKLYNGDVCNKDILENVFNENKIDAVIHFAGLKSVGESVDKPLEYYQNNIISTLSLCKVMSRHKVKKLIFSSSATVYGKPEQLPLKEISTTGIGITNPYGHTKYMIEQILSDLVQSDPDWSITILRYFNPIGAHESGTIGEDPCGIPNNLLPFISQVAIGRLPRLKVWGNDYNTPDGTCIRDYIHVVDLATGHIAALNNLATGKTVFNLGTGRGVSVLEMIHTFETATDTMIPYEVAQRRPGDVEVCYAECSKANKELSWSAKKTLEEACADSWRWQQNNPDGYKILTS